MIFLLHKVLPVAHPARIQMNKIGIRVKSDAAPLLRHGRPTQTGQIASGNPYVDGFARHVQAPLGHSLSLLSEEEVA